MFYNIGPGSFASLGPGNPYWSGRLSPVDPLLLTNLSHLLLILRTLYTFLQNKLP